MMLSKGLGNFVRPAFDLLYGILIITQKESVGATSLNEL
jgi:hypothetical protein